MKPDTIAELRRLLEAATPGPYVADRGNVDCPDESRNPVAFAIDAPEAALIAAAVSALPELLDAAEGWATATTTIGQWIERCRERDDQIARLTRELDEAKKESVRWQDEWKVEAHNHSITAKERDEAVRENTVLLDRANHAHDLEQECKTLVRELDEALAVLRDVEWSSTATWYDAAGVDHEVANCPVCGALQCGSAAGDGVHCDDCALARALGGGK